jgi:hypothetical protein
LIVLPAARLPGVFFRNDAGYRANFKETAGKSPMPKPGLK